ncbi:P21-activated protein kinase-interacting protein 1-like [Plakobranchus ocellatus]|uniref:P21-activated protein kinase-interacting protein 1-like n=1 Tax=Plakobranchus ocellatus TaxID=259542 RepID=A0AAV4CZ66_9GAST|nr:P21-activated protein kinase-interacting protein 1-like [Plakobranchus ocellatus]
MEHIEVVIGTYENLLIGYTVNANQDDKSPVLETSFTDDSHRGALRCVAVSPSGVLASSSTDDSIRLHSLKKRKEIGSLFEHSGTVNSMIFYDNNHMFSASEDGTICLWKTKSWEMMKKLKGHKSHVMAVSVHPSGKLALSVGSDRSFLTWDLVTGKLAFQRKLSDVPQNIFFTPSGDHYVLVFNKRIEVCSLSDTKVVKETPTEWRINTVCHIKENIFAIGGDDRYIIVLDVLKGAQLMILDAAKPDEEEFHSRVRCISVISQDDHKHLIVATASGNIKAFRLDLNKNKSEELFFSETRVRITAMGVYSNSSAVNGADKKPKASVTLTEDPAVEVATNETYEAGESESGQESDQSEDMPPQEVTKRKNRKDWNQTNKQRIRKLQAPAESSDSGKSKKRKGERFQ